jgi:uncharacterized DUF497 family protein
VRFEWNEDKARTNIAKHHIAFELARKAWDDPLCLIYPDRFEQGEERLHALGNVKGAVLVLVVHSYPEGDDSDLIRIIGALRATREERRLYESEAI